MNPNFPTREDANRLSEVGMLISGFLMRPDFGLKKSEFITEDHEKSMVKIFKFVFDLIEKKEQGK